VKKIIVLLLGALLMSTSYGANVKPLGTERQYREMDFSVFIPCAGNASFCAPTILAQGEITDKTAEKLATFVANARRLPPDDSGQLAPYVRVCFDSPGGSLSGGVRLGEVIRNMKLDTCVEPSYAEVDIRAATGKGLYVPDVICASACVFAFSGGINRTILKGSAIGVHQFYASAGQIGDGATQVAVVWLADYLARGGVKRELLDVGSLVPAKKVYWLSEKQILQLNLDNSDQHLNPWQVRATPEGRIVAWVSQPRSSADSANVTTIAVAKVGSEAILVIQEELHARFASDLNEALMALNASGGMGQVTFDVSDVPTFRHEVRWQANAAAKTVNVRLVLSVREILAIGSGKSLYLRVDCPHSLGQYDPSTPVSIDGALGALKAALR
jgi:hypothetical protein